MRLESYLLLIAFFVFSSISTYAQEVISYKKVGDVELFMEVYSPENMESEKSYPAMVFFFGGGWNGGSRSQFETHAQYFAQRGIVCFLADYRIASKHNTTPFESLKDAKSAIRFIRKNAPKFNVNPEKVIASGGSAGGHLAAAAALIEKYDESMDDMQISCIPNALVLFNPVIDNGPGGYGYNRIKDAYKDFSPLHNIEEDSPPTIFFLGTKDKLIPVETAKYYQTVMHKTGNVCELKLYEDQGHGFFNYRNFDHYKKTVTETDLFLQSLGYLERAPEAVIK